MNISKTLVVAAIAVCAVGSVMAQQANCGAGKVVSVNYAKYEDGIIRFTLDNSVTAPTASQQVAGPVLGIWPNNVGTEMIDRLYSMLLAAFFAQKTIYAHSDFSLCDKLTELTVK